MLPVLPVQLASTLALEALKYLMHLNQPVLVDRMLEFDGLHSDSQFHSVLIKPSCSACSKKKARSNPGRVELLKNIEPLAPLPEIADQLVSNRTGIVSEFAAANRDATEPALPMVWRARLANHCFLSEQTDTPCRLLGQGHDSAGRLDLVSR